MNGKTIALCVAALLAVTTLAAGQNTCEAITSCVLCLDSDLNCVFCRVGSGGSCLNATSDNIDSCSGDPVVDLTTCSIVTPSSTPRPVVPQGPPKDVQFILNGNIQNFDQQSFLVALGRLLNTNPNRFQILSKTSGSVILVVRILPATSSLQGDTPPTTLANNLEQLQTERNPGLRFLNVQVLTTDTFPESSPTPTPQRFPSIAPNPSSFPSMPPLPTINIGPVCSGHGTLSGSKCTCACPYFGELCQYCF